MVGYNGTMKKKDDTEGTERKASRKKSGKKSGLGLALWLLAALVLLILFLVYQNKIVSNLKETDFFSRVFGKTPAFVENHEVTPSADTEKNDVAPIDINLIGDDSQKGSSSGNAASSATDTTGVVAENNAAKNQAKDAASAKDTSAKETSGKDTTAKETPAKPTTTKPTTVPVVEMNIKLFFMEIDSDGTVDRHEVTRKMKKSGTPLVDAINALIAGPNSDEAKVGCRSLIPATSRLIGASVKDGVATLNFSGEFEFNQYGVEGTLGQLQQVVYTATAFPTVNSVQILVDGEKKEYLGSEGVWIGTPLNRNNYK